MYLIATGLIVASHVSDLLCLLVSVLHICMVMHAVSGIFVTSKYWIVPSVRSVKLTESVFAGQKS